MRLSALRPEHLKSYKDLLRLLIKYGRSDVVRRMRTEAAFLDSEVSDSAKASKALELPADLERLGPTYIKLGQFLSTRSAVAHAVKPTDETVADAPL